MARLSKRSLEGELFIDHRASPGLEPDFLKKIGLDGPSVGEGQLYESATVTCCHCGVIVVLNPQRTRARGHCHKCDKYVCDNPACNAECKPFSKVLDEAESQAYKTGQRQQMNGFILRGT